MFDQYINQFSDAASFRDACKSLAIDLGIKVDWLYSVFLLESSFDPWRVNHQSNAVGLIQFIPSTLARMGLTFEDIQQTTPTQQVAYVRQYLMPYKDKIASFNDLYLAVFSPHGIGNGDDPNFVLYAAGTIQAQKNKAAQDANGNITIGSFFDSVKNRIPANLRQFVGQNMGLSIGAGTLLFGAAALILVLKHKAKKQLKKHKRK